MILSNMVSAVQSALLSMGLAPVIREHRIQFIAGTGIVLDGVAYTSGGPLSVTGGTSGPWTITLPSTTQPGGYIDACSAGGAGGSGYGVNGPGGAGGNGATCMFAYPYTLVAGATLTIALGATSTPGAVGAAGGNGGNTTINDSSLGAFISLVVRGGNGGGAATATLGGSASVGPGTPGLFSVVSGTTGAGLAGSFYAQQNLVQSQAGCGGGGTNAGGSSGNRGVKSGSSNGTGGTSGGGGGAGGNTLFGSGAGGNGGSNGTAGLAPANALSYGAGGGGGSGNTQGGAGNAAYCEIKMRY